MPDIYQTDTQCNLPSPYAKKLFIRHFLWRGLLIPIIIGVVVNIPVLLIVKDLDSQVLAATSSITMLYWLCAFLKNFLYMMEIKEKYNQNPEETLEKLNVELSIGEGENS